jgi:hypothetical protein
VTAFYKGVLVGPIDADTIEGLDSGVNDGRSNLTVKEIIDAFIMFQTNTIETFSKTHKRRITGMTYDHLLRLFSCSPIKAIEATEYRKYSNGNLQFSEEELAAYKMRSRVTTNLRRHESASLMYKAMRAGEATVNQKSADEINYTGLLTLCQHRVMQLKRTASDADLDEPEPVAKRQIGSDGGWDLDLELDL